MGLGVSREVWHGICVPGGGWGDGVTEGRRDPSTPLRAGSDGRASVAVTPTEVEACPPVAGVSPCPSVMLFRGEMPRLRSA